MILQTILISCMLFKIFEELMIIEKEVFQDNVKQVNFGKSFR